MYLTIMCRRVWIRGGEGDALPASGDFGDDEVVPASAD